jgi:hypothetical protein
MKLVGAGHAREMLVRGHGPLLHMNLSKSELQQSPTDWISSFAA